MRIASAGAAFWVFRRLAIMPMRSAFMHGEGIGTWSRVILSATSAREMVGSCAISDRRGQFASFAPK